MSNMFEPNDLADVHWSNINSFEGKVYESPLFISCDGCFLMYLFFDAASRKAAQ